MAYKKNANCRPSATISFDEELLKFIDDYRFDKRKESRSEAVQELLEFGKRYLELREKKRLQKRQQAAVG
jgi:metal-responsive CopG/Arc/MetJ family transcriptional regulator